MFVFVILDVLIFDQGSMDLGNDIFIPPPPVDGSDSEHDTSAKKVEPPTDLFSLLYAEEAKHDRVVVPPSRWATFECKCTYLLVLLIIYLSRQLYHKLIILP